MSYPHRSRARTVRGVLCAARRLIEDPEHWTTGVLARDAAGEWIEPQDNGAVCWCAVGAVAAVSPDVDLEDQAATLLDRTAEERGGVFASRVNDERGHAAVLEMYDAAIKAATP